MCHHRTPGHSSPRADRVQKRGPCHSTVGDIWGDPALSRAGRTNGAGVVHISCPRIGFTLTKTENQDKVLVHWFAVHGEWNGYGGSGVARRLIPILHHIS